MGLVTKKGVELGCLGHFIKNLGLVTKTGVELGGLGFKNFVHKYYFIVSELLSYI